MVNSTRVRRINQVWLNDFQGWVEVLPSCKEYRAMVEDVPFEIIPTDGSSLVQLFNHLSLLDRTTIRLSWLSTQKTIN